MAASLLALLDDISTLLENVAVLTRVAATKTVGVLGDDLALNAQQVSGVAADRELPVVWAVAKGSALNKAILVPLALAVSAWAPWAVTPLLMLGGAFLCFEGVEKLAHKYLHTKDEEAARQKALTDTVMDPTFNLGAYEKDKVKGAIRTDFVLSAEIITITLGTVATQPLLTQFAVLSGIAVIMTIGVYGIVAMIVKLDDVGLLLSRRTGDWPWRRAERRLGRGILVAAPYLMRALTIIGTIAMFLVGGGILTHGIPAVHHAIETFATGLGTPLASIVPTLLDGVIGVIVGALVLAVVATFKRVVNRR